MENSRNPGFCGGGEDEERQSINGSSADINQYLQDPVPSIGIEGILGINQIQTAVEVESMEQQEPGQGADISTADSHSRRNIHQITEAEKLERKRRSDQKYRNKVKENQKRLKSTAETLGAENERLKQENILGKQKLGAKSMEFDLLKKNYDQKCENEQQMNCAMVSLKAENEHLKKKLEDLGTELKQNFTQKLENEQQMKSAMESLKAENEYLKKKLEDLGTELKQNFTQKLENEQQMNSAMVSLKAENEYLKKKLEDFGTELKQNITKELSHIESLKAENEYLKKKVEELGTELKQNLTQKLEEERRFNRLLGRLEKDLEILEEENGLKAVTIKSLNASLEEMTSKYSGEVAQLKSKLANLELASRTCWTESPNIVRRSIKINGVFGQIWERMKGVGQLSQPYRACFPGVQYEDNWERRKRVGRRKCLSDPILRRASRPATLLFSQIHDCSIK